MAGPGKGKILLGRAEVYLHVKGKSRARITHVDIEASVLNKIIKPAEASYVAGKQGGVFIGLKKGMLKRAERILKQGQKSLKE